MKRRTRTLLFLGLCMTGFGATAYYVYNLPSPKDLHIGAIRDVSPSMKESSCEAVLDAARAAIEVPDLVITPDSTYSLIVTGGYSSRGRARLVLKLPIPPKAWTPSGGDTGGADRDAFYKQIEAVCNKQPEAEMSAVYDAIRLGLDHLEGLGCGTAKTICKLAILSDGLDNVDRRMFAFLEGKKAPAPEPLPNRIAKTEFCGIHPDVQEKWTEVLESPARYRPYCEDEQNSADRAIAARKD